MIEAYAFLAAFALQILVVSVWIPARFIRYCREWSDRFGSERFAQLYPGRDYGKAIERFVTTYRVVNIAIAAAGLLVASQLYQFTQKPGWAAEVMRPTAWYFVMQIAPLMLVGIYGVLRYRQVLVQLLKSSAESKRKAVLQRRGLFDFVSPVAVVVAVLSYLLFIPFAIYVDRHVYGNATISRYCYLAIAGVTAAVVLNSFVIYRQLYGKNNPLITHEGRVHTIGGAVKSGVYGTIATIWFVSIMSFVTKLQLENWRPFATSFFFVICMLLGVIGLAVPPRTSELDETGPDGQVPNRGL